MALKVWRFATFMLTAVAMAAAVGHLMELPAKMDYDASLYVMLHRTLYPNFGRIAGVAEILAVLAAVALAWRLRGDRAACGPAVFAAACLVSAHIVFWVLVQPANATMAGWEHDQIPGDWTRWRNRWEYAHAARAGLIVLALGAQVISLLREPVPPHPAEPRRRA